MPNLRQGCFRQAVVLICSHDTDHAMGVIINRHISDMAFADLLEQVDIEPEPALQSRPVHFGGPVETRRGIVIHSLDYQATETINIKPDIGLTATKTTLSILNKADSMLHQDERGPAKAILCMGHAGWSAGQLEHELAQNAWINIPATQALVFQQPVKTIWQNALASLGLNPAMLNAAWSEARDPDAPLN